MLHEKTAKELSVLIVDDNFEHARLLRDIFYALKINKVDVAHNAARALLHIKNEPYRFVVIDMEAQKFQSLELVKEIRKDLEPTVYSVPIIVLSGNVTKQDVADARDAGATEFMTKPVSVKAIEHLLVHTLEKPRNFIISRNFIGPDRRRRDIAPPDGTEKRSAKPAGDTKVITPPQEG